MGQISIRQLQYTELKETEELEQARNGAEDHTEKEKLEARLASLVARKERLERTIKRREEQEGDG